MGRFSVKQWLLFLFVAILFLALLGWRAGCTAAKQAQSRADIAVTTGEQLDKVAAQTPVIRQDQKEKEDEIEQLPGADQPLPDGFGAELERVRRGGKPHDPG